MDHLIKVLVTDDEEGMRLGVKRALRNFRCSFDDLGADASFEVQLAASGEECLEALERDSFCLVMLDYKLPGINGIETLGKAMEIDSELIVVMMTAYASLETAVQATKQGAFDFLAKPFTPEELRATVRKAVRNLILQRQAKKLAEEKRKVRFEFISVLSHELKAPIGAVEGYLELIRSGHAKDEAVLARAVERSMARLGGMRKLIFDILDLTRIESGTKVRTMQQVNLKDVAEAALELVETSAASRSIVTALQVSGDTVLLADRSELDIVMNNLVSNAVKYNRDKGSVSVSLTGTSEEMRIDVGDSGIGMSKEEVARLFGEFVRIKNAKTRNIEGSGLGLSTVKKIAQLYDGDVRVSSVPDEGSTFTVLLKRKESDTES